MMNINLEIIINPKNIYILFNGKNETMSYTFIIDYQG